MRQLYRNNLHLHIALACAVALITVAVLAHFGVVHVSPEIMGGAVLANLTPAAARVVDPVLTTAAQGYKHPGMVGDALFPPVPVDQRGGKIVTFGREDFRLYSTIRAPGSATKRVQFGYSGGDYALEDHSLEGVAPIENMQEAAAVPGINLGNVTVRKTQRIIALRKEKAQADLATTAANYPAANKVTLAGNDQWSAVHADSDPSADIETGKEAVRAQIGLRPNTVIMGPAVWAKLKYHATLLDRVKYTSRDSLTTEMLAQLWEVERVLVGEAVYLGAGDVQADVWGKFCVVAYTELGTLDDGGAPSYGYTYQLRGHPFVEQPYYDRNTKSWIYPVTDALKPVIASNIAGYLISAAVA